MQISFQEAEEARLQELADSNHQNVANLDGRLSQSELSNTSVERYWSQRSDKENLSMKSESGVGIQRRMSLFDGCDKKGVWK